MSALLSKIRVLDLSRVLSGPWSTQMLADLGADVIKIEATQYPDWWRGVDRRPAYVLEQMYEKSVRYCIMNRNKRGITLDLKSDVGKEVLWKLIDGADVLVENFSPGTAARLGLGPDDVLARKPMLIYASVSGFGQTGPSSQRPAYDLILQGMGGMMSVG